MNRCCRFVLFTVAVVGLARTASAEDAPATVDPAEVRRQIAALAEPDETAPSDEQAVNWLSARRNQIVPQLIAALDDRNPKIAEQCLDILRNVAARKDLTEALLAKAGDRNSPLRYKALRQLEKSAADPRMARLLGQAGAEAEAFPDPLVRARWFWLAGRADRAVSLLKPTVETFDASDHHVVAAIRLLGEIGGPASIALLQPVAAGDRWSLAAEAYQALAMIDPENHGLTPDQAALLKGWRGFKETTTQSQQRLLALAQRNPQELRPLVMQMLRNKDGGLKGGPGYGQRVALVILAAWKDKDALPQIRRIMEEKRTSNRREAVAAFLAIDDAPEAQQTVLNLPETDAVLRGIVAAPIPAERKVAILRAAQTKFNRSNPVPQALRHEKYQNQDIHELLIPLMDGETSLPALAGYCELAADDKEQRFAPQVRRAMRILARYSVDNPEKIGQDTSSAAAAILRATATYDLQDAAPDVRTLMNSQDATIRAAAQSAGAKLRIPGAIEELYARLGDADANRRAQAAQSLLSIAPADETERAAREKAVLTHLGKPSEDDALRVLVTCGGERSIEALRPILNDADARRAVYAAWVLAQFPDEAAARTGLRRVAIFASFHHQGYQQGSGIDFELAPKLNFHQTTERLNPNPRADAEDKSPVRIPADLLRTIDLNDDEEQEYAIRCYRLAEIAGHGHSLAIHFLNGRMMGPPGRIDLNATHLPLLREIAARDARVERVMIKGQTVAHFPYRRIAARAISEITQEPAAYLGLAGETIDAQAFPQPYPDQDRLLARHFVDRVRTARLPDAPRTDRQWTAFEIPRNTAIQLRDKFGPQILDAIRAEARHQQVDIKHVLPSEGS